MWVSQMKIIKYELHNTFIQYSKNKTSVFQYLQCIHTICEPVVLSSQSPLLCIPCALCPGWLSIMYVSQRDAYLVTQFLELGLALHLLPCTICISWSVSKRIQTFGGQELNGGIHFTSSFEYVCSVVAILTFPACCLGTLMLSTK